MTRFLYNGSLCRTRYLLAATLLAWGVTQAENAPPDAALLEFLADGYADAPEFELFIDAADQVMNAPADQDVSEPTEEGVTQ